MTEQTIPQRNYNGTIEASTTNIVYRGLTGHLNLVCSAYPNGQSYLSKQGFRVPIHISKPYWDGNTLIINIVNPTAGMLEGDGVECHVAVESKASLLLTNPSATRVHTMRKDGVSSWNQNIHIAKDAWLEYFPEVLILQQESHFEQTTKIEIDKGGELLFFESIAPGRVAFGESFAFRKFRSKLEILYDSQKIVREHFCLEKDSPSLEAWRSAFPTPYYAGVYCISEKLTPESPCWEQIAALHNESIWVGPSKLHHTGWVIKILAENNITLRKTLAQIRKILTTNLNRKTSDFRRV